MPAQRRRYGGNEDHPCHAVQDKQEACFNRIKPRGIQQPPAYGRYWYDVPEGRKRRVITLGVCTTRTVAKRKLREHIEAEGINSEATLISTTAPGMMFREQAKRWIASLATRRRRPVKPATIFGWQHELDKWILPTIGDMAVAEVSNAATQAAD